MSTVNIIILINETRKNPGSKIMLQWGIISSKEKKKQKEKVRCGGNGGSRGSCPPLILSRPTGLPTPRKGAMDNS